MSRLDDLSTLYVLLARAGRMQVRTSSFQALQVVFGVLLLLLSAGACTGRIELAQRPDSSSGPTPGSAVTREAVCALDQLACAGQCVDGSSDSQDCGQCANACGSGSLCQLGHCQIFCAQGQQDCGGACTTVASNLQNCGTCGSPCPSGQYCNAGSCSAECPLQLCDGKSGLECADIQTNPEHCGGCGALCAAGESCVQGVCELVCPDGRAACGGACVQTQTDAENCGSCGNACASGVPCIAGACGCPVGQALCNGSCVDVLQSSEHCGSCTTSCGGGSSCQNGVCQCGSDKQSCGDSCVDPSSDPAHCGDCAKACAAEELCDLGSCKPKTAGCSPGLTLCGASCVDLQASSGFCGSCQVACAAGQSCVAGACACPGGGALCGGNCVDIATSNTHCGTCDNPCTAGRSCSLSQCVCPAGQLFCGGACVDVTENEQYCGACDVACTAGRACTAGQCECEGTQAFCDGACIDTETSNEHCGDCGVACDGGQSCASGECVCPQGQDFCGETCIDPQSTDAHCGGCDKACALGKSCVSGLCTGGGGTGEDGCSGLAKNVSVAQVAVYQSVKIPVMNAGGEVAPPDRNTDVIAGRETMIRVFVNIAAGFSAHEVSARLILVEGDTTTSYYQKKTISKNSEESDAASTFQLFVPKDKVTTETRFYVELVDCTTTSGSLVSPRYPAGDADAALGARATGGLKVKVIPINCNSRVADTSSGSLDVYKAYLSAMYPVNAVEITVGGSISTNYPVDWGAVLDQVRSKRQSDAPAADVYYYGLLKCADTFSQFCGGSCTTGIGYVAPQSQASQRAAVGVAYVDNTSSVTMAHELGHNHGRNHSPCSVSSGVDTNYPYEGGVTGVWGYDSRTKNLISPTNSDIMGYCSNKWISDYTYDALVNRVSYVNGAAYVYFAPERLSTWRVLLLDDKGPRWGIPIDELSPASGEPEVAEVLDEHGDLLELIEVYRTAISDIDAAMVQVPEPQPEWHAIRIPGWPALAFAAPVAVPLP